MKLNPTRDVRGKADQAAPALSQLAPEEGSPDSIRPRKILVPIDFSETSRAALLYAVPFAEQFGAALMLVYVVPTALPAEVSHIGAVLQYKQLAEDARQSLDRFRQQAIGSDLPVETIVLTGGPDHEITEAATKLDTDLIIISTHGHTGLKHALLGSTAERVVRHAPCPVLAVRAVGGGKAFPRTVRNILVPVDFSKPSESALRYGALLARRFGAEISLVHVVPLPTLPEYGYAHTAIKAAELKRKAKARLDELAADPSLPPGSVKKLSVRTGSAYQEIVEEAEARGSDLIVLSTRGHTGLARLLLGSTAERVVRYAHCPVLVVRKSARTPGRTSSTSP